jgi:hypothetical protein
MDNAVSQPSSVSIDPLFFHEIAQQKCSKMFKAICLALAFPIGMSAVLALRPSNKPSEAPASAVMAPGPSTSAVGSDDELNLTSLSVNTWSKADKLPVAFSNDEKKIVPVEEIGVAPIVQVDSVQNKSEPKQMREVTSWHWHEGSKKVERH